MEIGGLTQQVLRRGTRESYVAADAFGSLADPKQGIAPVTVVPGGWPSRHARARSHLGPLFRRQTVGVLLGSFGAVHGREYAMSGASASSG